MNTSDHTLIAQTINDFAYFRSNGFEGTASIARTLGQRFSTVLMATSRDFDPDRFMAVCVAKPVPKWRQVDEARFDEMLGIVPPFAQTDDGFLVGEAQDNHGDGGKARFWAFVQLDDTDGNVSNSRFYESVAPMTVKEWREFNPRLGMRVVNAPKENGR